MTVIVPAAVVAAWRKVDLEVGCRYAFREYLRVQQADWRYPAGLPRTGRQP